ncbi:MAG: efflux RND transporter periplasmic adaptor subunit, partial [Gemmatimonadetes bacterium]|nr:efflux RND transporter periplasmic adaptor subunit [Gemmatimonadota bacterium]
MSIEDRVRTDDRQSSHLWLRGASLALVLAAGCGSGAEADGAAAAQEGDTGYERIINVEVTPVAPETFVEYIRLTGTVLANQDVTLSAEEGGVIREILVEKGTRIQAGDPLFRIDDEILRAQVDQARAMANMASETWDRRKRLYEEDQVGSELMYLEARYAVEQALANLRVLEERLERTTIRAPIAGILDSRQVEIGTMVGVGTPVGRIIDHAVVKINGGVPERYA